MDAEELRLEIKALIERVAALEKIDDPHHSEIKTELDALLNLHDLELRITKLESRRTT